MARTGDLSQGDGSYEGSVAPSREDPALAPLTQFMGGPWGAHTRPRAWFTPVRVLLLVSAIAWLAGMATKTLCVPSAWQRSTQPYAQLCWNDWEWTSHGGTPSAGHLPPVPALVSWLVGHLVSPIGDATARVVAAASLTAVIVAAGLLVATVLLARRDPMRPWDAAVFALAPMLVLSWLTAPQTMAAIAVALALYGWSRRKGLLCGISIGVAAATMLPAGALLFAVGLVRTPARRQMSGEVIASAIFTWLVLGAPRLVLEPDRFAWWVGPVDGGSLWLVLAQILDLSFSTTLTTVVSALLWAGWFAVVALLVRRAPGPVSLAQVGLLLVGGALVVSPSLPPAASLVLLPLAAVAVPRWAVVGGWQAAEVLFFVVTGWYLAGLLAPADGGDQPLYWIVATLRIVAMVGVLAVVVRQLMTTESKVVAV